MISFKLCDIHSLLNQALNLTLGILYQPFQLLQFTFHLLVIFLRKKRWLIKTTRLLSHYILLRLLDLPLVLILLRHPAQTDLNGRFLLRLSETHCGVGVVHHHSAVVSQTGLVVRSAPFIVVLVYLSRIKAALAFEVLILVVGFTPRTVVAEYVQLDEA